MNDQEIYNRSLNHFIKLVFCAVITLLILGIPILTVTSIIFWSYDITFGLCMLSIIDCGVVWIILNKLVEDI